VLQSMDIFDQLHHKLDRAIAAKARQSKVNDALRGDLAEVNREVERLKRMCNDLREATTPMTREIEFLEKSLEDTCKDLENANRDKKELEARNGALSNEIYQLQHMLDSVREQKDHTTSTQLDFWAKKNEQHLFFYPRPQHSEGPPQVAHGGCREARG
jgi:chromosome segregation ATPase